MKKLLLHCLFLLSCCGALMPLHAQLAQPATGGRYLFGTVAATGQLGQYLNYTVGYALPPSSYTVDWNNVGSAPAPTACTFQVEGSSDAVHWYALTGSTDCTAGNMIHIAYKPVVYCRINVLTYASSGGSAVLFNYTRGQ